MTIQQIHKLLSKLYQYRFDEEDIAYVEQYLNQETTHAKAATVSTELSTQLVITGHADGETIGEVRAYEKGSQAPIGVLYWQGDGVEEIRVVSISVIDSYRNSNVENLLIQRLRVEFPGVQIMFKNSKILQNK